MKFLPTLVGLFAYCACCGLVGAAPGDEGNGKGKVLFSRCPDFKLEYPEFQTKIDLEHILGQWHMIRNTCPEPEKAEEMDCIKEHYYIDDGRTPANHITWVMSMRNRTEHKTMTESGVMGFTGRDGDAIDNFFEFDFSDPGSNSTVYGQTAMIDTDEGNSWSLWAVCMEPEPSKPLLQWSIFSRHPWIDAKLEQWLVERVEKYGGVPPKALRGIGQTDCFKHPKH